MEALVTISSIVAPLVRDNVDTDAIIPAVYMRSLSTDPATGLFARWRFRPDGSEEPSFVLNDPRFRVARILLSGANFGCGSSRENAVWALQGFGFRCIIALGFSDIFYENCFKNRVLPLALDKAAHANLVDCCTAAEPCFATVDIEAGTISTSRGDSFCFELDERKRSLLMSGADEIDVTLAAGQRILAFRNRHRLSKPWLYESPSSIGPT